MKRILFLAILVLFIFSCRKEELHPSWDVDMLLPLAQTQLSIHDILVDSIHQINADSSISLIYQTKLASLILDTIAKIPDTAYDYVVSLNEISLNPYNFSYHVSMGDIANKDKELNGSSSPLYTSIMTAHNTGQPTTITSFGPYSFDSIEINMGEYFKYVYIHQAIVDITINNQLPIPLTNLNFKLIKPNNQQEIINTSFPAIAPHTSQTSSTPLSNIVLDSLLMGDVTISSPGSGIPVTIDTSQSATATITIRNLQIDSAIARFPSQQLLNYNNTLIMSLPDSLQISEAWLKSGFLSLDFYNTIKQNIHLNFSLPAVTKNGQPFQLLVTIPASDGYTPAHIVTQADVSDYTFLFRGIHAFENISGDLNGNGHIDIDTLNSLYYKLEASIDSSGQFITLTKNDSITAHCTFQNFVPDYIKGFFGYKLVSFDSIINYTLLNNLNVDLLHFEQANFSISLENQIGTTAKVYIEHLKAINTQQSHQISLQGNVLQTPFVLTKPIDPHSIYSDVIPTLSQFSVNSQNSNIQDLISILPNQIDYGFHIHLNDGVTMPTPATASDFVYYGDKISTTLNVEIPLSFYASNLVLCDTAQPDFSNINIDKIISGNLILHSSNLYPIDVNVRIYLLDINKNVYDSIHTVPIIIQAGVMNTSIQKVIVPRIDKNIIPVSHAKLDNFLKAKYIVFKAVFNTKPDVTHIKIYDSYTLKLKIVGDFNYTIEK